MEDREMGIALDVPEAWQDLKRSAVPRSEEEHAVATCHRNEGQSEPVATEVVQDAGGDEGSPDTTKVE